MAQGPLTLVLTSLRVTPTHVERMLTLQYRDQSLKRTVAHLQFTSWPELYAGGQRKGAWGVPLQRGRVGGPGSPDRGVVPGPQLQKGGGCLGSPDPSGGG